MYTVKENGVRDVFETVTRNGIAMIEKMPVTAYVIVNERGEIVKDINGEYYVFVHREAAERQAALLNEFEQGRGQ